MFPSSRLGTTEKINFFLRPRGQFRSHPLQLTVNGIESSVLTEKGYAEISPGVVMEIALVWLFTSTGIAHKHPFDAKDIFIVMLVSIMCGAGLFPQQ
jgi:hypothetical protein